MLNSIFKKYTISFIMLFVLTLLGLFVWILTTDINLSNFWDFKDIMTEANPDYYLIRFIFVIPYILFTVMNKIFMPTYIRYIFKYKLNEKNNSRKSFILGLTIGISSFFLDLFTIISLWFNEEIIIIVIITLFIIPILIILIEKHFSNNNSILGNEQNNLNIIMKRYSLPMILLIVFDLIIMTFWQVFESHEWWHFGINWFFNLILSIAIFPYIILSLTIKLLIPRIIHKIKNEKRPIMIGVIISLISLILDAIYLYSLSISLRVSKQTTFMVFILSICILLIPIFIFIIRKIILLIKKKTL